MQAALWIILSLLIIWIVFCALPAFVVYKITFAKRDGRRGRAYHLDNAYFIPHENRMKESLKFLKTKQSRNIEIKSFDNIRLCAEYYDIGAKRTAILMHGYSSLPMANFCVIAAELIKQGFNVLLPYERAHGESEGDKCTLGALESKDLIEWVKWCGDTDILLYGISMGGVAVAFALDKLEAYRVKLAVIDCAFDTVFEQMERDANKRHIPSQLVVPIISLFAKIGLGIDIKASIRDTLSNTGLPVIFLHGDEDSTVPLSVGQKNYEACSSDKLMLIGRGAEHTMAYLTLTEEEFSQMTAFMKKYI